jgi:hypothetical protein
MVTLADESQRDLAAALAETPGLEAGAGRMPVHLDIDQLFPYRLVLEIESRQDHDAGLVHAGFLSVLARSSGRVIGGSRTSRGPGRNSRAGRPVSVLRVGPAATMKPGTLWTLR